MERIRHKIGRIREHLNFLKSIRGECQERFESDRIYSGALLHYLYLLADGCIVLAELVIKYRNLRAPQSYAEAFDILGSNGILESGFAYRFASIAGFRNFLAHDYERVDGAIICDQILAKLDEVDEYLKQVERHLSIESTLPSV
jgi:uncharacterized protein YutE (UPF0331/DUF86 family)